MSPVENLDPVIGYDISLGNEALKILQNYEWPGNSRELLNIIERALASMSDATIRTTDLPSYIKQTSNEEVGSEIPGKLKEYMQEAERKAIKRALDLHAGRRNDAAKSLGIHRTLLYKKMKALGIEINQ